MGKRLFEPCLITSQQKCLLIRLGHSSLFARLQEIILIWHSDEKSSTRHTVSSVFLENYRQASILFFLSLQHQGKTCLFPWYFEAQSKALNLNSAPKFHVFINFFMLVHFICYSFIKYLWILMQLQELISSTASQCT